MLLTEGCTDCGCIADIRLTKTGPSTQTVGNPFTFQLVVTNQGPDGASIVSLDDPMTGLPAGTTVSWTSTASGGATGNTPTGTGPFTETLALPANGRVVYNITHYTTPGTTPAGTYTNTATAGIVAGNSSDPTPATATHSVQLILPITDLTMTHTGPATALAGDPIVWTLKVLNAGTSTAHNVILTDSMPAALTGWTWSSVAVGGAFGNTPGPSASSLISEVLTLPPGSIVTYTITGTTGPLYTGQVNAIATLAPGLGTTDPTPPSPITVSTDVVGPISDIHLTKAVDKTTIYQGQLLTFTTTVRNSGPQAGTFHVDDPVPTGLLNFAWTAAFTGGAAGFAAGAGSVNTDVYLPVGGQVKYTIKAYAPVVSVQTTYLSTVDVTLPPGYTDSNGGLHAQVMVTQPLPYADIQASKVVDKGTVSPFGTVTWLLSISNNGLFDAQNLHVQDLVNTTVVQTSTWTAAVTGGATTPVGSGSGDIDMYVKIPKGGVIEFTISQRIKASAASGTYINTADLELPSGLIDPSPVTQVSAQTTIVDPVPLGCVQLKYCARAMTCGDPVPSGSTLTVTLISEATVYDPLHRPPLMMECNVSKTTDFVVSDDPDFYCATTCPLTPNEGLEPTSTYYLVTATIGGRQCAPPYKIRIPAGVGSVINVLDYIIEG